MDAEIAELLKKLEVHPLGDNGEVDILPASEKNVLSTSQLPCGLPPVLPDTKSVLRSFLENPEKLPIFHLDAVQKLIPIEPDISSLYSIDLCPLQTTLSVKRNMKTGKLLKFTEEVKDGYEGTYKTSFSLSRAPGPPDAGVKGLPNSFPFWPGGMDEPWANILKQENTCDFHFDEELLDTPPGFKCGMKFPKISYDQVDYMHSQPQKIYLSDVLAMDDSEFLSLSESEDKLDKEEQQNEEERKEVSENEDILKITSLPVLKIKDFEPKAKVAHYEWAVVEDVNRDVEDFEERIPELAHKFPFPLDKFQKRAILHLEKKESVLVAAHTSSGKTAVAEYAVALAKKNVTKVIYTSPIKALSNQKYKDFREIFVDVGLITGDVQLNPTAFCLIMTTEILRSMLYHGSDKIRELEWVVFDEVHYINDPERGGVWEEVFIMLPDHVNLIMLSATVPNTAEFAEWLGGIKKRKIYVISTSKRPVDLEYFLYTGSIGKSVDEIFPIVDASGKFLDGKYTEACKVKKGRESKSKSSYGPRGFRGNVHEKQEKNIYLGLIEHLRKRDLLPAICFTFSRKRCRMQAEMLASVDLTTDKQKSKINAFIKKSLVALKDDRELPQVILICDMVKRGFGIHHSGILPIMKEIVEMLVKEKFIQVLFTTETFAMGVNMPARTVVFDSIQKHDGKEFRDLKPSEFIQMAGRAGRRGLDDTGTVILLCKGDIPDPFSLRNMILGKPQRFESQFKLTYRMILNLLKFRTFRVEDVMKRSFGERENIKEKKKYNGLLSDATNQLSNMNKPDCSLCNVDLEKYFYVLKEATSLKKEVMPEKCSLAHSSKILAPGRIITLFANHQNNVPGVLLSVDKESKCKVLIISEKNDLKSSRDIKTKLVPWTKQLFYPTEKSPEVITALFEDIQVITNKTLRVSESDILKDWLQAKMSRSRLGHSISTTFQDLCSLAEANLNGFSSANITFKEMNFVNTICRLESMEKSLDTFTCIKCPEFNEHFLQMLDYLELKEKIKKYKYLVSEESLTLHPQFEQRKEVLKILQYIDEEGTVQLKGAVAREMSNHELLITELLVKSVFTDCSSEQVAALLSCMVFQQKTDDEKLELSSELDQKVLEIQNVAEEISQTQRSCGLNEPNFVQQYNFHLTGVVYDWANGMTFAEIMQITEVEEGIIVRTIQRLSELLKEVRNGAKLVGDTVLAEKMDQASQKIKRDIVFAPSLYTIENK